MARGPALFRADLRPGASHPTQVGSVVLLVICLGGLSLLAASQWRELRRSQRFLEAPLLAHTSADYGDTRARAMSAPVALAIVDDMIRDSQPEPADLPARLAHVSTLLTTPVPVAAAMTAEASEALNQTHDAAEAAGGTETSPSGKSGPPGKSETAGKPKDPGAPDTPGNSDHGGKDRGSDKSEHSGKGRDSAGSKKQ